MKTKILVLSATAALLVVGCKPEEKKQTGTNAAKTGTTATSDAAEGNDGFYTGFDGVTDFSLLVPRFRSLTVTDTSIAKVESVKVTLSATTIDELVAEAKKTNPAFEDARFKQMLGREQTVYRITPLKAGSTTIKTTGGRGGQPGKQQSGWSKTPTINLVVKDYTQEQVAAGKKRYTTDGGGGNLRACKSCHETGAEGAPPHELGRIMEISDKQAMTWITTGKLEDRTAKVQHTWEFSTDEEQEGIIPYLRSKQTHDVETLTKLFVEEQMANGGFMGPGQKPPTSAK